MEGNGESALGVGLPDTGNESVSDGNVGASALFSELCRSMMGGRWVW